MRIQFLHKILLILLLLGSLRGQDTLYASQSRDVYSQFMSLETTEERFAYFFENNQRYSGIAAYRWRDALKDLIERIDPEDDPLSRPYYQTMLCQVYYDMGDFIQGAQLADLLLADDASLDLEVRRVLLKVADGIYAEMQLFDQQLEVRKDLERLGEEVEFYSIYTNLGLYRHALIDYEIRFPKDSMEAGGDNFQMAKYYKDRADFKRKDGQLNLSAVNEYEKAFSLIEDYINIQGISSEQKLREALFLRGQILGGIGKSMLAQERYDEAIPYLELGVEECSSYEAGKYLMHTAGYWTDLAESYLNTGSPKMAGRYLDSIGRVGKIAPSNQIRYFHLKADYFLDTEATDSAVHYLELYSRGRDSLERASMGKQMLGQIVAFDIDQQTKRQLQTFQLNLKQNESELLEKGKIIYLSVVALLFSMLCVVALIVAYMKSVKNKRLIENQKQIIENSLIEKDSLLKEIHHRVKNNLQMVSSLLSLQSKNTRSKAAIMALEEGQSRVKAMALIHQKLYQNDDLSVIEMQEYIESLVASIHSIFKKEGYQTSIHINASETRLDVDRAIPIGLILNELVSNSFKYAFAQNKEGNIYITLKKQDEEFAFEYQDDGSGLPEDFEQTSVGSMGLRLIRRLANQLRSNLQIDTQADGARFWFNFG